MAFGDTRWCEHNLDRCPLLLLCKSGEHGAHAHGSTKADHNARSDLKLRAELSKGRAQSLGATEVHRQCMEIGNVPRWLVDLDPHLLEIMLQLQQSVRWTEERPSSLSNSAVADGPDSATLETLLALSILAQEAARGTSRTRANAWSE
eukprot:gene7994-1221_t